MNACFSEIELKLYRRGYRFLAGVDEAGRGPLAGPLVAAAVVFPPRFLTNGLPAELATITDSKRLTAAERERLWNVLRSIHDVRIGIGVASEALIDRINIVQATRHAMILAVNRLGMRPDYLLVDGKPLPDFPQPAAFVVGGDRICPSISAASIVAKVVRDRIMNRLDRLYPGYGFSDHKGYPTARHLSALRRLGPSPVHRRTFRPVLDLLQQRFWEE